MDERRHPGDLTRLLEKASGGNRDAFDELLPHVYEELKKLARSRMRFERSGHTLNATALVHEAYLKLVDQDRVAWKSRSHFFAVAARAMRRILINHANAKMAAKRGGDADRVSLTRAEQLAGAELSDDQLLDLLALEKALQRLGDFNPAGAEVVEYRFFGGLTLEEIGTVTGVSEVTARRRWSAAKAWLRAQLTTEVADRASTLLGGPA